MMRKLFLLFACTSVLVSGTGWAAARKKTSTSKNPVIEIVTTRGTIEVTLYPKDAPKTCANFVRLVDKGFYNGIVFHRVEPGFVAQAGDPYTKKDPNDPRAGTGGATDASGNQYTIEAEIKRRHERGTLAMARTADQVNPERRSSSSQFYICLANDTASHLDGGYTAFGKVTKGMDVVDKIQRGDKIKKATVKVR